MADQPFPPDVQALANDIASYVAERLRNAFGDNLRATLPPGCTPGRFECPRDFACNAFAALVKEPKT
jgi:hypothetical protein